MENKIHKRFNSLEDLEFELLREIKVENLTFDDDLIGKFNELLDYGSKGCEFAIVVKILNDKIIAKNERYFYTIKKSNYDIGDIIGFKDDFIFKLDKEILNKEFLEMLDKKTIYYNKIDLSKFIKEDEILTKEKLEKEILKRYKNQKQEQEQEEKEKQKKEKQKKEDELKRINDFKEKGICKFSDDFKVDKKIIISKNWGNKNIFTFKKDVNKLFDYDTLKNKNFGYGSIPNLSSFEGFIINKKMDYTKEKQEDGEDKIKLYELEFERNTKKETLANLQDKEFINYPKIKGVRIPQNKLGFILSKIRKEQTKEQIELLKKLTNMKMDLLGLNKIDVGDYKIDISISLIDENNFEVEFMNKNKILGWDILKDVFFYGGSSRSISRHLGRERFLSFCEKFNIIKQDIFTYLKKLKMLEELKENES